MPSTKCIAPEAKIQTSPGSAPTRGKWVVAVLLGGLGVWLFWSPLFHGAGLIGGDLYPYFLPQKQFLSDSLRAGQIPLWNPLVGFGYPVLGESQTAALYPPNLLLYSWLPVNIAYNASQLLHYLVTFLALFAFAQRMNLRLAGGLLAATVFTFGWFPARICLEWAIIGGCWFAVCLWAGAGLLQTGRRRYAAALALGLGMDLLAGHYNLAFITLLLLVPLPWLLPRAESNSPPSDLSPPVVGSLWRRQGLMGAAIALGFLIGAVQVVPTWELKSLSQRERENDAFAPTYGALPPAAISQLWMPWAWYRGEKSTDEMLQSAHWGAVSSATNQVEAQLYLGLLPLGLALAALVRAMLRRGTHWGMTLGWSAAILVSLFFATGWPTYWLHDLPGIGFFRGPGRYSIVAACGIALLAGKSLDEFFDWRGWNRMTMGIALLLVWGVTMGDLWAASRKYDFTPAPAVGRQVFYATIVEVPPITKIAESLLRQDLDRIRSTVRLYAPGQNIPTLLNVSAIPTYLGLGPEFYESPEMRVDFRLQAPGQVSEAVARLRRFGVSHLLLEIELNRAVWPVKLLGPVMDPVLNGAFGRREPFFLYELNQPGERFQFLDHPAENRITRMTETPQRVSIEVEVTQPDRLVFRDLWYPGWEVVEPELRGEVFDQHFRSVSLTPRADGNPLQTVTWVYRPRSVWWGGVLSLLGLAGVVALVVVKKPGLAPAGSREGGERGTHR